MERPRTVSTALILSSIELQHNQEADWVRFLTCHRDSACIYMKPLNLIGEESPYNLQGRSEDSIFYSLEKILDVLGVKILHIEEKMLDWDKIKIIYQELVTHLDKERKHYPQQEDIFRRSYEGLWKCVIVQGSDVLEDLQERLCSIKGLSYADSHDNSFISWSPSVMVRPLRAVLGDRRLSLPYDNNTKIPVRFNLMHVPSNRPEAIQMATIWNAI